MSSRMTSAIPAEWQELYQAAMQARKSAYAPYSLFPVGAAIRSSSGIVYAGCNIENASSGLTVCAERVAAWNAIVAGVHEFISLVVVTEDGSTPCGACRQVLAEFGVKRVLLANRSERLEFGLEELLPRAAAGILDRIE